MQLQAALPHAQRQLRIPEARRLGDSSERVQLCEELSWWTKAVEEQI
jgi:hypothetical protein